MPSTEKLGDKPRRLARLARRGRRPVWYDAGAMDGTPENAATAMSGTGRKRVLVMLLSPLSGRMAGVARFARERGWHLMFHDRLGLSIRSTGPATA